VDPLGESSYVLGRLVLAENRVLAIKQRRLLEVAELQKEERGSCWTEQSCRRVGVT
jgi:hypothetical protein